MAPYGSGLRESNLGQALYAVTGTRLGLWSFLFLERFLLCLFLGRHAAAVTATRQRLCNGRTLLHSPTGDGATPRAFLRLQQWLASCRCVLLVPLTSVPSGADRSRGRTAPGCAARLAPVRCAGRDRLPC